MTHQVPDTPKSDRTANSYLDSLGLKSNLFEEPLHFLVDADENVVAHVISVLATAERPVLLTARNESDRRRMLDKVLLRSLPVKACRIAASLMMDEWEMLVQLAKALQLSTEGKDLAALEHDLSGLISGNSAEAFGLLYIIEEAQLLSESVITYLVRFARNARLKLLLISASAVSFERFDEQDLFRWQLADFSSATTRQYLDTRFRLSGCPTPEVFDDHVVAWICNEGQGDQHLIDQAALRVLEHSKLEAAPMTRADYFKWMLLLAVALLLFPGVYLLNSTALDRNQIISAGVGVPTLTEAPVKMVPALPFRINAEESNLAEGKSDINPASDKVSSTAVVKQAVSPRQVRGTGNDPENSQLPDHLTADWLKRVNPEFYTIQVIGSHSREKIDSFMKSGKSAQGYAWFESSYNAKPWYVVIKGIYPDRDTAAGEAARVKKDTGLEPWVRSFENINQVR